MTDTLAPFGYASNLGKNDIRHIFAAPAPADVLCGLPVGWALAAYPERRQDGPICKTCQRIAEKEKQ